MPTVAAARNAAGSDNADKWLHPSQCHVGAGEMRVSPEYNQRESTSPVRKVVEVLTSELDQIHPLPSLTEETCALSPCNTRVCPAHAFLCTVKALNQGTSYLKASPLSDIQ